METKEIMEVKEEIMEAIEIESGVAVMHSENLVRLLTKDLKLEVWKKTVDAAVKAVSEVCNESIACLCDGRIGAGLIAGKAAVVNDLPLVVSPPYLNMSGKWQKEEKGVLRKLYDRKNTLIHPANQVYKNAAEQIAANNNWLISHSLGVICLALSKDINGETKDPAVIAAKEAAKANKYVCFIDENGETTVFAEGGEEVEIVPFADGELISATPEMLEQEAKKAPVGSRHGRTSLKEVGTGRDASVAMAETFDGATVAPKAETPSPAPAPTTATPASTPATPAASTGEVRVRDMLADFFAADKASAEARELAMKILAKKLGV